MNRLSPLIQRRPLFASAPSWGDEIAVDAPSGPLDDLRLFFIGWLGGLVFFGTFLA